jgi:hypothetical protein
MGGHPRETVRRVVKARPRKRCMKFKRDTRSWTQYLSFPQARRKVSSRRFEEPRLKRPNERSSQTRSVSKWDQSMAGAPATRRCLMVAEGERASRPMHPESNGKAPRTELPEGSRTHGEESGQFLDGSSAATSQPSVLFSMRSSGCCRQLPPGCGCRTGSKPMGAEEMQSHRESCEIPGGTALPDGGAASAGDAAAPLDS